MAPFKHSTVYHGVAKILVTTGMSKVCKLVIAANGGLFDKNKF